MDKLVSIVLPTFNGEEFIKQSIESVLNQSYKNLELIIVDDCSTDRTGQMIEEFAKRDSRVKIIHNAINQKLPKSLNVGFKAARGEYWTWTSDDNYYLENALREMVNYLEKQRDKVLVCADYTIIKYDGSKRLYEVSQKKEDLISYDSVGACFLYRSETAKLVGEYDESQFKVEDYDYWLRMGLTGEFGVIRQTLYAYRQHPNSLTGTQQKGEVANKTEKLLEKYLPLYLQKYPNLDLDMFSQLRLCYLNNAQTSKIRALFKKCDSKHKKNAYIYLRNRFVDTKDKKFLTHLYCLGLYYRIKFWIWSIRRKHLFESP